MRKKTKWPEPNHYNPEAPNFEYDHHSDYYHSKMAADHPNHHEEGYLSCAACSHERAFNEMSQEHGKRNLSLSQFAGLFKRK
jgi:hypothetical protein